MYRGTRKTIVSGGNILEHPVFSKILSIGYEFECGNMFPVLQDSNDENVYFIPSIDEDVHDDSQCIEQIGIHSNYSCAISYETDIPHTNTTPSLLSVYEDKLRSEPDNVAELMRKCGLTGRWYSDAFMTHTELLFTFFNKDATCHGNDTLQHPINHPNCIQETFLIILELLQGLFEYSHTVDHRDMRIIFFRAPHIIKPIFYCIPIIFPPGISPEERDKDVTPQDIKWVPQMTYSVEPQYIMEVTRQLSKGLNTEELNIIKLCIATAEELFRFNKKKSPLVGNPLVDIFKNVSFFILYYTHPYFHYDDHRLGEDTSKDTFCFLFRHSLDDIFDFYMLIQKQPLIRNILEHLKTKLTEKTTRITRTEKSNEETWKSFVCGIFLRCGMKFRLLHDDMYEYEEYMDKFTSEIFDEQSNYYPFDGNHVLIEFRCFHKNIVQTMEPGTKETDDNKIITHRTLNEWREIMKRKEPIHPHKKQKRGGQNKSRRKRLHRR